MEQTRCKNCFGAKKVNGMGYMPVDCPVCKATGFVDKEVVILAAISTDATGQDVIDAILTKTPNIEINAENSITPTEAVELIIPIKQESNPKAKNSKKGKA